MSWGAEPYVPGLRSPTSDVSAAVPSDFHSSEPWAESICWKIRVPLRLAVMLPSVSYPFDWCDVVELAPSGLMSASKAAAVRS